MGNSPSIETEPSPRPLPEYRAREKRELLAWCLFIAVLAFCAHFWFFRRFGIYEDDFWAIPPAATNTWSQLCEYARQGWAFYAQGRPVGWMMWRLIPWLLFRIGNLGTVYFFSGWIVAANCVLLFLLLRRCWGDRLAILGGLAYTLCPADTCRQMLVHTHILQVAVLYFMIAAHCCLSEKAWVRWGLTYFFCVLILLTYESPFLPLLVVPLMVPKWDRRLLLRWIAHGAICMALLVAAAVIRMHLGEARLVQSTGDSTPILVKVIKSCWFGPTQSMPQWYERVLFTLREASLWGVVPAMVVAFIAIAVALLVGPVARRDESRWRLWPIVHPLLIGAAILFGGYAFAITPDHYLQPATYGRMTSVHLAAIIGAAVLVGVVLHLILQACDKVAFLRVAITIVIAGYFAILVGFGFIVQRGFVVGAKAQQTFWSRVLGLCPDISGDTVILAEGGAIQNNWFALTSSWSDPAVLPEICKVPSGRPPTLVVFSNQQQWHDELERRGDQLVWKVAQPGNVGPPIHSALPQGNTILLRRVKDRIQRVDGDVQVHGVTLHLKPIPPSPLPPDYKPAYMPGSVYPLIIRDEGFPPAQRFPGLKGPMLKQ